MSWVYSDANSRGIQKATEEDPGYLGSITFRQQNDNDDKTKNNHNVNKRVSHLRFFLGLFSILGVFRAIGGLQNFWESHSALFNQGSEKGFVGSQGSIASHHPTVCRSSSDGLIPNLDTPPLQ